jgi:hypothetical protein
VRQVVFAKAAAASVASAVMTVMAEILAALLLGVPVLGPPRAWRSRRPRPFSAIWSQFNETTSAKIYGQSLKMPQ